MPAGWAGRNIMLNFQAVYYNSEVYVDGRLAGRHFGGSTGFAVDVTRFLKDGKAHDLVVHAYSDTRTTKQPAGKQNVRQSQFECMYTRTTGIWQTVWMEPVDAKGLKNAQVITDIDQKQVIVHPHFYAQDGGTITVTLKDGAKVVATKSAVASDASTLILPVKAPKLWSPESPFLYDLTYEVRDAQGNIIDKVASYIGMRKFHCVGNKTYLNNEPFYQRASIPTVSGRLPPTRRSVATSSFLWLPASTVPACTRRSSKSVSTIGLINWVTSLGARLPLGV